MESGVRVRLLAAAGLLASLAGMGALTPFIASSAGRNELEYTDTAAEGDPPEVALGIAMGAFRGIFVNYLWIRANNLKQEGRYHESIELARAITKLQPRFPRVWAFHAWNLAYNISVGTQTPQERWQWVTAGIDLLKKEGIPANPNDMLLYKELSWIYIHKVMGYTDDSNRYYKRQVAADWTVTMGDPPALRGDDRERDRAIGVYIDWLTGFAEAPGSIEAMREQSPGAGELADRIAGLGYGLNRNLLERVAILEHLDQSLLAEEIREGFGPNMTQLAGMFEDPSLGGAWETLLLTLRRQELVERERMNPQQMIRVTRKFGPLDWRSPAAHALYWAYTGVERGLSRVTELNEDDYDFVNTDRMLVQAIQELWRYGTIYFNYVDFVADRGGFYMNTPNEHFIYAYNDVLEKEIQDRGGIFESDIRTYKTYAAGYENFLKQVIPFYYRRGQLDKAEFWYRHLRTWEGQNIHDTEAKLAEVIVPLDEFVRTQMWDQYESPQTAVAEVTASLQASYEALITGDLDLFRSSFQYAAAAHAYFLTKQLRDVVAARGGGQTRMEVLDRNFPNVAGTLFAEVLASLPPEEAVDMYNRAPADLQAYAYDVARSLYQKPIEEGQILIGESFELAFPEPPGLERARAQLLEIERARASDGLQGFDPRSVAPSGPQSQTQPRPPGP